MWGINTGGKRTLTNLRFADDMLLFAKSKQELLQMIQQTEDALRSVGLSLNLDKTVILKNDDCPAHIHSLSGQRLDVLEKGRSTKYLGACLGFGLDGRDHVSARIQAAWASYAKIKKALQDRSANTFDKLRLFDLVVTPAALYATGVVDFRENDIKRLQVIQRTMLRQIAGTSPKPEQGQPRAEWEEWHHVNTQRAERMLVECGGKLWANEARGKSWDWAGHVLRMSEDR